MILNPYAKFLGERNPVELMAATSERLEELVGKMTREQADVPIAPGKWSVREIVAHLADAEIGFGFRLRQTLGGESHLQPFDQDAWAKSYARYTLPAAMECFRALRAWNLLLVRGVSEADKTLPAHHPERGDMVMWTIVETMAGHDVNHLLQLERFCA